MRVSNIYSALAGATAMLLAVVIYSYARPVPPAPDAVSAAHDPGSKAVPSTTTATREMIDSEIHRYIADHPEEIADATPAAQAKRQAALLQSNWEELANDPSSPVLGNPNGDVTIVEFTDYRCPYCKAAAPILAKLLEKDPNLRLIVKQFAILGDDSVYAAGVALAASRHGHFREVHEAMFAAPPGTDNHGRREAFDTAVSGLGLDLAAFQAEGSDAAATQEIERNKSLARTLGISGTPTIIVGRQLYSGAPTEEALVSAVAAARDRQQATH